MILNSRQLSNRCDWGGRVGCFAVLLAIEHFRFQESTFRCHANTIRERSTDVDPKFPSYRFLHRQIGQKLGSSSQQSRFMLATICQHKFSSEKVGC